MKDEGSAKREGEAVRASTFSKAGVGARIARMISRTSAGFIGLAVVVLVGAGCGGPKYSVDYDPNARFDGLKTYRIEKNDQLLLKAREELLGLNLRGSIEGAIDRALGEKGYSKAAGDGAVDFLVRYSVAIEQ